MICDVCKCNVKNFKQHIKTKKHNENSGLDFEDTTQKKYDYGKDYQKKYNNYRNYKGKEQIKCEYCDKMINKYNINHHYETNKHIKNKNNKLFIIDI